MTRRRFIALAASTLAAGCDRAPLTGPPELRVGRVECVECGMLVAEDRFCGASLVEHEGRREYVFFDDIGCMLDYEHDKQGRVRVLERYVRDYHTRAWVPGLDAAYVLADRESLRTPMGSGIAAFADRAAALALAAEHSGVVHDLASLAVARREWMWSRFGRPADAPPVTPP
jgi:copper chaperone NosL